LCGKKGEYIEDMATRTQKVIGALKLVGLRGEYGARAKRPLPVYDRKAQYGWTRDCLALEVDTSFGQPLLVAGA
jgi:hypothetical protein